MIDLKWTADLAWAVGLLVTDGSLSKDGRHLDLTSKDLQLLQVFREALSLNVKIGEKTNGMSSSKQHRVQFGDVRFYRWLQEVGMHPNKSKTLEELSIPGRYYADFFRGVFDGDGSISSFWDKRWSNSYMYYLAISSASPHFLKWLRKKNKESFGVIGHIAKAGSIEQLKYAKRESKILFKSIYYKENLPRLLRKHERFIEIINEDPYA